jgi:signal transduction histidine kinase
MGTPVRLSHPAIEIPRRTVTGFSQAVTPEDEWRVYTLATTRRTVQVAQQMSVREELATSASLQAALPIALLIPLSWLALTWIIDRIMARLNRLAAGVAARDAVNGTPIPLEDVPAEIVPFVRSINDLLTRLQAVLDRQRRFVSNAAHELRTPLSALLIQIENLRQADGDGRLAPRLSDLQAGIRRAAALVGQLLRLARYDADEPGQPTRIDLVALTLDGMARVAPLADDRSIDLGLGRRDAVTVIGSEADLSVVIGNLLDNAIRYTPSGGTVDISITADGPVAILEIQDTGPGIREDELPRVFERFFRAAPLGVEGSGLGLAIAKAAAERNNAGLALENRTDRSGIVARLMIARGAA